VETPLYGLVSIASTCFFFLFSPPQTRRSGICRFCLFFRWFYVFSWVYLLLQTHMALQFQIQTTRSRFPLPPTSGIFDLGAPFHWAAENGYVAE
jgi:hypothetical protein